MENKEYEKLVDDVRAILGIYIGKTNLYHYLSKELYNCGYRKKHIVKPLDDIDSNNSILIEQPKKAWVLVNNLGWDILEYEVISATYWSGRLSYVVCARKVQGQKAQEFTFFNDDFGSTVFFDEEIARKVLQREIEEEKKNIN